MTILHVITGLPKASGVTTFVENVVREQRALGHEVRVVTNDNSDALHPDIIHIHGLWSPLLHRASRYAARHHIPVVWSTHGMTAPWSLRHKWWKKCIPWYLYQRPDLRRAALIHCTTDLEEGWNRALGLTNTFIAPLGTTLPVDQSSTVHLHLSPSPSSPRTLLYVGRIYPVKALDNLIRAFALAVKKITIHSPTPTLHSNSSTTTTNNYNWILRLVGPDQAGHMSELMALCDQLGLSYTHHSPTPTLHSNSTLPLVEFAGPKYGAELDAEYENCTALALVSHTENFGATVVDALAHGKPVITSTNTPWKIVTEHRCGYWVPNDPETLSRAISQLFNLSSSQLRTLGANGRQLVEERYTWSAIAHALDEAYQLHQRFQMTE